MSKKKGTKTHNIFHRKDATGRRNDRRVTCSFCDTKHYEQRYHYCVFKPSLLDLYCCAGGAGVGYYRAGFNVTGIDIVERRNYFCDFIQEDAIKFIELHGCEYDFIHASPPCQRYSKITQVARNHGKIYPDLVDATRQALMATGRPFVLENVPGAPLRKDLELRGEMFNLKVIRRRIFEFGNMPVSFVAPGYERPISVMRGEAVSVFGAARYNPTGHGWGNQKTIIPEWKLDTVRQTWAFAMGIDHYCTDREISESIPPAYTEFIGKNILKYLGECPTPVK